MNGVKSSQYRCRFVELVGAKHPQSRVNSMACVMPRRLSDQVRGPYKPSFERRGIAKNPTICLTSNSRRTLVAELLEWHETTAWCDRRNRRRCSVAAKPARRCASTSVIARGISDHYVLTRPQGKGSLFGMAVIWRCDQYEFNAGIRKGIGQISGSPRKLP